MMFLGDQSLESRLQILAKSAEVESVDSAVHEAEAIRWADDGIACYFEDGAEVNLYEVQVAAEVLPGCGERFIDGCEDELHGFQIRVAILLGGGIAMAAWV